jgi:hypothetical protein
MRHYLKTLVLLGVLQAATAGGAFAQDENGGNILDGGQPCSISWNTCMSIGHITTGGADAGVGTGNHTSSCMQCLMNGNPATAQDCHPCGGHLTTEERAAYFTVLQLSRSGDVSLVLRKSLGTGGHVVFNQERGTVQITSCDYRTVVANLPVKTNAELRMALALPRGTTSVAQALGSTK